MKVPASFKFRIAPWKHQRKALTLTAHEKEYALTMEQGTGKTKVVLDTAALLYLGDKIDALVVVAPDGVQRAWIRDHLPKHMSPDVKCVSAWYENRLPIYLKQKLDAASDDRFDGLRVIAVNYELLLTKPAQKWLKAFLKKYRTLLVSDESHRIKNPKSASSQAMYNLADHAAYRRTLTGTPYSVGPLDIYGQYLFLNTSILGDQSLVAFRARHCVMMPPDAGTMRHFAVKLKAKYGDIRARDGRLLREIKMPQLVQRDPVTGMPMYRDMEILAKQIKPYTFRVLKKDCLDLPPKIYEKRYVRLNSAQRQLYNALRDEYFAEMDGKLMTTTLAITRLTRLQQITGGFFKADDEELMAVPGKNPKLISLLDTLAGATDKVLIWARFVAELEMIADTLEQGEHYGPGSVARYWGDGTSTARDKNKKRFIEDPLCRFFVSQPKAGGTGLDGLQVASTVVYFSNEFSLLERLQSEDRAHRGGSEVHESVTIIDIEAEDTLDAKIIDGLRNKKDIADIITGDDPRRWL